MYSIIILSKTRPIRSSLKELLEYEKYTTHLVEDIYSANNIINEVNPSLIICYLQSDDNSILEEYTKALKQGLSTPVIFITDVEDNKLSIYLKQQGAINVFSKPINIPDFLETVQMCKTKTEALELSNKLAQTKKVTVSPLNSIIGTSDAIMDVKRMIELIARSEAKILITGENGTGKELVTKCIHSLSSRRDKPIIEVNCAAIPHDLIESELFGHEKGSFTSAIKQHKGKFEQANGGTLFLDEIGDMCLSAQAKVLRTLQEGKITRVGGNCEIAVDVRVISATNKNLKEEIKKGTFREDLFHRLGVLEIHVPTLNKRIDDLPLLINDFISKICKSYDIPTKSIDNTAIEMLQSKNWSGNIRELHNAVERLIIFSPDNITCDTVSKFILMK